MSSTLTARSRALVVLLVMALVALTGYTALASGGRSDRGPIGHQPETQIGTALKLVRNADGSVTRTES